MDNAKPHCEHLFRLEKVADIRLGEAAAGRAVAFRVDGQRIALIFAVVEVDYTIWVKR